GLEAIDGPGESRLGRLSGLKLVPERPELLRLVGGQEPKKALGCQLLPLVLLGAVVVVVEVVARVDLDNVVNEQHLDHASYVEGRGRGKLSQDHGHDGQVPRVLGGVFAARSVQQPVAAGDALELVDFPQEMQLTFKTCRLMVIVAHGGTPLTGAARAARPASGARAVVTHPILDHFSAPFMWGWAPAAGVQVPAAARRR